jgi:hypothetical protein
MPKMDMEGRKYQLQIVRKSLWISTFTIGLGLTVLSAPLANASQKPTILSDGTSSSIIAAKFNTFRNKSPAQIHQQFINKGFVPKGPNPQSGRGGYQNPKTGRSYHIDPGGTYGKKVEAPHVDVNRRTATRGNSQLSKRKFPTSPGGT